MPAIEVAAQKRAMNQDTPSAVDEVLRVEAEEIAARRRNATSRKTVPPGNGNGHVKSIPDELSGTPTEAACRPTREQLPANFPTVGLALSGGGIRSGSFSLGFLQALYRRGILKHVDYLSTVSGGGYAGAFFSSLVLENKQPRINWNPREDSAEGAKLDILPDGCGRQPKRLSQLLFGGCRLNDPLPFLSHWFLGVLLLNLWALSGLVAILALLAYLFRRLDTENCKMWLAELGATGDIDRTFVLPMLSFLLWIGVEAGSKRWRRLDGFRRPAFAVFCALLAMGICSMLFTGDISSPVVEKNLSDPAEFRAKVRTWSHDLEKLLLAALVGALLPYLNPKALLRSGTRAPDAATRWNAIERWIFAIASRAFLFGVPLLLFGLLASENISGYNEARPQRQHLTASHIARFDEFFYRVASEHKAGLNPGKHIWNELIQHPQKLRAKYDQRAGVPISPPWFADANGAKQLENVSAAHHAVMDRDDTLKENLLKLGNLLPWNWTAFSKHLEQRNQVSHARRAVVDVLNEVLADPRFIEKVSIGIAGSKDSEEVQRLLAEGTGLYRWPPPDTANSPLEDEVRRKNWDFLIAHYGNMIRSPDIVFNTIVGDADQSFRLSVFRWSLLVTVVLGLLIDLNGTSLNGYYRRKLAELWINESPQHGYQIPLSQLSTTDKGGPYHLLNGTLNLMWRDKYPTQDALGRFTFSRRFCGSKRTGYVQTDSYFNNKLDLADALAISGAAVNPAAVANPLARVLMLLLNFRLGQWLPNPACNRLGHWWGSPLRLFINFLFWKPEDRAYCFVSDGGHDENSGVGALLERRCRVIIAVDASFDPDYSFVDMLRLIRLGAAEHGVRIVEPGKSVSTPACQTPPLPFDRLIPAKQLKGLAQSHYFVAHIVYPPAIGPVSEQPPSYLILVKPNFTGDEPTELLHYRKENPDFPHDPSVDQFYEPRRFACYRQLGEHTGEVVCDELFNETRWPNTTERGWWLADEWTLSQAPSVEVVTKIPAEFNASTRAAVLHGLCHSDPSVRRAALELFSLDQLPAGTPRPLLRQAVEDLITAFWAASAQHDTTFQVLLCAVISKYVSLQGARSFLKRVSRGGQGISDEVVQEAQMRSVSLKPRRLQDRESDEIPSTRAKKG